MSESDRADSYLDMNWNPLAHQAEIQRTSLITPPPLFSEMKTAAAKLAEGFAFVCIAFQTDGKQIYFSYDGNIYYVSDEQNKESNIVKYVKNTFKDRLEGKDPQLDAAIAEVLKEMK